MGLPEHIGHREAQGRCQLFAHAAAEVLEVVELLTAPELQALEALARVGPAYWGGSSNQYGSGWADATKRAMQARRP